MTDFKTYAFLISGTLASPLAALDAVDLRVVGASGTAGMVETLREASGLASSSSENPRDILAQAQSDYARLVEALYAMGHYSGTVNILLDGREAARFDPFADPDPISSARIIVDPGPKFTFGRAEIAPLPATRTPTPEFQSGAPALATAVRDAADTAVSDWRQAGHAKARIAGQDVVARHDQAILDVGVGVAPGPRLTFGKPRVTTESGVRDARIRQIAGIPTGEQFDPDDVAKAESRLRRSGAFKSVTVTETDRISPDGQMEMDIAVADQKLRRLGAGAELSSVDGLTLSAFWLHRNLLGGAERFRVDAEIAQIGGDAEGIDYALSFSFEKPAVYGPDTHFNAGLSFSYEDEPDYISRKAALTFGVSREFNDHLTGELGLGVSYSEVTDRFQSGRDQTRELLLFSLPGALTYDRRDDALDTTQGFYVKAGFEPFYESLKGLPGLSTTLDARGFYSPEALGGATLAARLQLGSVMGPDAEDAPPDLLFYSGGGGTVRGHPYQSLDADYGDVSLGGRSFAALSAEARVPLGEQLGVVAFADAGLVSSGSYWNDTSNWHAGAGLGVRYKTPIGPIRLDLAAPVAGDTGDGIQIYVGIGQAF